MFNVDEIKANVNRGFNKLTREQRDAVDLHTLHMDSDWDCVLGQIFGRYTTGMELLFPEIPENAWNWREQRGAEYGFFQSYSDPNAFEIYAFLQTEWMNRLTEERV